MGGASRDHERCRFALRSDGALAVGFPNNGFYLSQRRKREDWATKNEEDNQIEPIAKPPAYQLFNHGTHGIHGKIVCFATLLFCVFRVFRGFEITSSNHVGVG